MPRGTTKHAAFVVLLCAGVLACSVPADRDEYEYPEGDVSAGAALGLACDEEHPCGDELDCVLPSHCVLAESGYVPGAEGGLARDRCDDEHPCAPGYSCAPVAEVAVCTRDCESDADCPEGGLCWLERGPAEGRCVRPGGLVADPCELETDCMFGLGCENRAQQGYCTRECEGAADCPAGMDARCLGITYFDGLYCMKQCDPEGDDCPTGAPCTPVKGSTSDSHVCFPDF